MSDTDKKKRARVPYHEKQAISTSKYVADAGRFANSVMPALSRVNMSTLFRSHEVTTTMIHFEEYLEKKDQEEPMVMVTIQFNPKIVKKRKKKDQEEDDDDDEPPKVTEPLTVQFMSTKQYLIDGVDLDTEEGLDAMYTFVTGKQLSDVFKNVKLSQINESISLEDTLTLMRPEIRNDIKSGFRKHVKLQRIAQATHFGASNPIIATKYIF